MLRAAEGVCGVLPRKINKMMLDIFQIQVDVIIIGFSKIPHLPAGTPVAHFGCVGDFINKRLL